MSKGLDVEVIGQIFTMLQPQNFHKDDKIYNMREVGGGMYFIIDGTVGLTCNSAFVTAVGKTLSTVRGGQSEQHLQTRRTRKNTNSTPRKTLSLTREAVDIIRGFCPDFHQLDLVVLHLPVTVSATIPCLQVKNE